MVGYTLHNIKGLARLVLSVLLFALFCNTSQANGQRKPSLEYQVKAAFLFNFTKFITWPETAFKSADAPFVIGIVGDDPFGAYLDELVKDESLDTHPIVVQRYASANDIGSCHMLFVNTTPAQQQQIIASASGQNLLTISDAAGFAGRGGAIAFFKQNNNVRIEINVGAAKNARLEISSKLLNIAKIN